MVSKKAAVARVYLPPDANCLVAVGDHCLRSANHINVIIASKNSAPAWLPMDDAQAHAARGASAWEWASNDAGAPDVVLAAAGDVPTLETIAAAWLLRRETPELRVRVVNVIDLFSLMLRAEHPHGLPVDSFARLFGDDLPVIFAFHGYPRVIHELIDHRPDPQRFHVRGYIEEGTTTTPFDMVVRNRISRYQLALEALERARRTVPRAAAAAETFNRSLTAHAAYITEHGVDMPEVSDWRWTDALAPA
jgi:xylulose-5-phosphate/fructose-6-phosphate phosphoketolase